MCKICQGHENILKDESFLKDQTEMCSNPYRAFRGLVSLPEIDHQAAHCIPQPGLGVFSSNVFSAVQLSKLTEQKMCPQVQKQINSILCFHIDVPVWIIFKILGIHLAYPCGKEPIENGDNWGTGITATHCVGYGSQNRERGYTRYYAGVAHGQRLRVTVGLFIAPHSWGLAVQSTHPFGSPCNVQLCPNGALDSPAGRLQCPSGQTCVSDLDGCDWDANLNE